MTAVAARSSFRLAVIIAAYAVVIVVGSFAGQWISGWLDLTIWPHTELYFHRVIISALGAYVLLTALPFVPGVELGFALIGAFGPSIVPVVYIATVTALMLSFAVGRLIPERWLAAMFGWTSMLRAEKMVSLLATMTPEERVRYLTERAPARWAPWLLKHRLFAIAVLINLPGSSLLGGGGGISMAVGLSRLVSFPKFAFTAVIAVSPLPIAILLTAAFGHTFFG